MGGEILRRLLGSLEKAVERIPDSRKGNNKQYSLSDVVKSAFAVFFFQYSSVLAFQRKMEDEFKQNNARTLLGIDKIPGDTQIRNLLDEIDGAYLSSAFHENIKTASDLGVLKDYRILDDGVLIAIDGLWYHASEKVHCDHCLHMTKEGVTTYYHCALAAAIVRPESRFVLPVMGELIKEALINPNAD